MADYTAKTRSNEFRVKDEEVFLEWAASRGLRVWEMSRNEVKYFVIYNGEEQVDGWPTVIYNEETEEELDVDIEEELAEHLQEGSVAVLLETGSMGYQDIFGFATTINSKGESVDLNLDEIFSMAESLGPEVRPIF